MDVGSGSGYLTVCMARLVDVYAKGGIAVGIDSVQRLVDMSHQNLRRNHAELLDVDMADNFVLSVGDGWAGVPAKAPFNAIHVGAAAAQLPQALVDQLHTPGRLIVPLGPAGGVQTFVQIDKDKHGHISQRELFGVSYVPLVKV
mmetsp:Transcript_1313/g.1498  ORF Transcript_1313/g.1498 Transcript_1313/m.1498 type:complete len:144 (-) Transcript_1313:60-491(-)